MPSNESSPVVLYEDNHCLGVKKPWNMLVQPDETGDKSLYSWAQDWIRQKYHKAGNVYVGLVHRLDRPAGGVVLLARTSKAASRLSEQFREGGIGKDYLVVVEGHPGPPGERVHYLQKNEVRNKTRVSLVPGRGRRSRMKIKAVWRSGEISLLWIQLDTGRSHQIRAQLSHEGCPVAGDLRYGASQALPGRNIALFAWRVVFEHPTRKTTEVVTCKPPVDEYPWSKFRTRLEALGTCPEGTGDKEGSG